MNNYHSITEPYVLWDSKEDSFREEKERKQVNSLVLASSTSVLIGFLFFSASRQLGRRGFGVGGITNGIKARQYKRGTLDTSDIQQQWRYTGSGHRFSPRAQGLFPVRRLLIPPLLSFLPRVQNVSTLNVLSSDCDPYSWCHYFSFSENEMFE